MKLLDADQQLNLLNTWVESGQPFLHLRFNDGESDGMLHLKSEQATTSGEHHHFRSLGDELRRVFLEVCHYAAEGTHRVLLGSYLTTEPHRSEGLAGQLTQAGIDREKITWAVSDFWYTTERESLGNPVTAELLSLLDTIRNQPFTRPVTLVANSYLIPLSRVLHSGYIEIPRRDAWLQGKDILAYCRSAAQRGALFIWCGGLPAKVWAWDLFRQFPQTSHIDAGSHFDAAYGIPNRAWQLRKEGPHMQWYREVFMSYLGALQ